jgi:photosystem II stability/assembly factor-like uncharacterized protein
MSAAIFPCILVLLCCASCSLSTDATWTKVTSPVEDPLHNGCFVDAEYGWIISYGTGVVLHTADGGGSWRVQARLDPLFYEDLCFSDRREGWICGEQGTLLHTRDGGATWRRQDGAPGRVAYYGIHVLSDGRMFLAGHDATTRAAVLLTSDDGGAMWAAPEDSVPGMALEPIQFIDQRRGYAAGGRTVLRTADAGQSWTPADIGRPAMIRGLFFRNREEGWVVGHAGVVARTADGGSGWRALEVFTRNRLRSVLFIDARRGFIAGDRDQEPAALWSTADGGATWTGSDPANADLHRLFRGGRAIWAVGKSGTILRYPA